MNPMQVLAALSRRQIPGAMPDRIPILYLRNSERAQTIPTSAGTATKILSISMVPEAFSAWGDGASIKVRPFISPLATSILRQAAFIGLEPAAIR
jgi:hypothetical protein